jgi:hypothetical protein
MSDKLQFVAGFHHSSIAESPENSSLSDILGFAKSIRLTEDLQSFAFPGRRFFVAAATKNKSEY